jgi:ADP-heptose:LPS heptosyltransferase
MRVAVFKVNMLGDNLVFVPVVQELVKLLPEAEIRLYTAPVAVPLYAGAAGNLEVVALPPGALKAGPGSLGNLLGRVLELRRFAPDLCVVSYDCPSLLNLAVNLSGARHVVAQDNVTQRIKPRATALVPFNREELVAVQNWKLVPVIRQVLGLERDETPASPPIPDLTHMLGAPPARVPGRVVIHPGASLEVKRWFPERYLELARRLAEREGIEVCWVEHDVKLEQPLPAGARKVRPGSLAELGRLLASANLFIGNNSGPMHLAYSLGTPAIIPCGPSRRTWDPAWHADRVKLLRHPDLWCLPCDHPERPTTRCVNAENPMACMRYWEVDDMMRFAEEMLEEWSPALP